MGREVILFWVFGTQCRLSAGNLGVSQTKQHLCSRHMQATPKKRIAPGYVCDCNGCQEYSFNPLYPDRRDNRNAPKWDRSQFLEPSLSVEQVAYTKDQAINLEGKLGATPDQEKGLK